MTSTTYEALTADAEEIGEGVWIRRFTRGLGDKEHVAGFIVIHRRPDNGEFCASSVWIEPVGGRACWYAESLDPLTLTPSLHCRCGVHGWIKDGRWVPA